jgi:hypothetical protein
MVLSGFRLAEFAKKQMGYRYRVQEQSPDVCGCEKQFYLLKRTGK